MKKQLVLLLLMFISYAPFSHAQTCTKGFGIHAPSQVEKVTFELGSEFSISSPVAGSLYQWFLDGESIDGANQSSYSITAATYEDTGIYTCQVDGTLLNIELDLEVVESAHIRRQREILTAFYHSTGGDNWSQNDNWNTTASLDDWFGVNTDACGNVIKIKLDNNNLTGVINDSFKELKYLSDLNLQNEEVGGTLDISQMPALSDVEMTRTSIEHVITNGETEDFYQKLHTLNLPFTKELKGVIDYSQMPNIQKIYLQGSTAEGVKVSEKEDYYTALTSISCYVASNLTGEIDIRNMPNLESVDLRATSVTSFLVAPNKEYTALRNISWNAPVSGSMDISGMPNLQVADLSNSDLTELTINKEEDYYQGLKTFKVFGNKNLNQDIDISQMPALERVTLQSSGVTGLIINEKENYYPYMDNIGAYTAVNLSGTIDIRNMPNLNSVDFRGTNISEFLVATDKDYPSIVSLRWAAPVQGSIDISRMPNLEVAYLYNSNLTELIINTTDEGYYQSLKTLNLLGNKNLAQVIDISQMPALEELILQSNGITELKVNEQTDFYPNLKKINLFYATNLTGTLDISNMPNIEGINASAGSNIDKVIGGRSFDKLTTFKVENNSITFDDLAQVPQFANGINDDFTYHPQSKVLEEETVELRAGEQYTMSAKVDDDVVDNYQWFLNGQVIDGATEETYTIESYSESDKGTYTCKITNVAYPSLTLSRNPIIIEDWTGGSTNSDRQALIDFYYATDGDNWSNNTNWLSDQPLDEWFGVTTILDESGKERVFNLYLSNNNLSGDLPSEISQLQYLKNLNLSGNQLTGSIPSEIGQLQELSTLRINNNRLSGSIPTEIGQLQQLQVLGLGSNQLTGSIPAEIGQLQQLQALDLGVNQLSGSVPAEIGQLSQLRNLTLSDNQLSGSIPTEIGQLQQLQSLGLSNNQFSGIPVEIASLNLFVFVIQENALDFTELLKAKSAGATNFLYAMQDIVVSTTLANGVLSATEVGGDQFQWFKDGEAIADATEATYQPTEAGDYYVEIKHSELPDLTFTSSSLTVSTTDLSIVEPDRQTLIDFYHATGGDSWRRNTNWLSDKPIEEWYGVELTAIDELGRKRVSGISLVSNRLSGSIPIAIGQLEQLQSLDLSRNQLSGSIPVEISLLRQLKSLVLRVNRLSGNIPIEIGQLEQLQSLDFRSNQLSGSIPAEIGKLEQLQFLDLAANELLGSIPSEIGQLRQVQYLDLAGNELSGSIPSEIGQLEQLEFLKLINNQLSGSIPSEIAQLRQLQFLEFSDNQLSGSIPAEIGQLTQLQSLNLSRNRLSGSIPTEIGDMHHLRKLFLSDNDFIGISAEILNRDVVYLSGNRLSFIELLKVRSLFGSFFYQSQNLTVTTTLANGVLSAIEVGGNQFQWYKDGVAIVGATEATYQPTEAGAYYVEIKHSELPDLTFTSSSLTIHSFDLNARSEGEVLKDAKGTSMIQVVGESKLYPNPVEAGTTAMLTINVEKEVNQAQITVYDANGGQVYTAEATLKVGKNQLDINTLGWKSGIYTIRVEIGTEVLMKKLVVN